MTWQFFFFFLVARISFDCWCDALFLGSHFNFKHEVVINSAGRMTTSFSVCHCWNKSLQACDSGNFGNSSWVRWLKSSLTSAVFQWLVYRSTDSQVITILSIHLVIKCWDWIESSRKQIYHLPVLDQQTVTRSKHS